MKKKLSALPIVLAFVLLAALIAGLLFALGKLKGASQAQELEAVRRGVENGITLCYSIEGAYPESLDYLSENYGVTFDADKYIVHYDCFADNIRPAVTVIERTE